MSIRPTFAEGELRAIWCADQCTWTPEGVECAYEAIVQGWTEAGVPPNRLAAQVPGVGKNWGSFHHKHKRLERTRFQGFENLSMSHRVEGTEYSEDAPVYAVLSAKRNYGTLWCIPTIIGSPVDSLGALFKVIADAGKTQYGYFSLRRFSVQPFPPPPTPLFDSPEYDLRMNTSWWTPDEPKQSGSLLLRDIYIHNYLSAAHLDAPIGKTAMTLREWIEDDSTERGTLKPFTDTLTEWTPPVANIPHIREALFRAGRLFYWRFFNPSNRSENAPPILQTGLMDESWQDPEQYYRPNIHEPWEATGPIPEMFEATRYHELYENRSH